MTALAAAGSAPGKATGKGGRTETVNQRVKCLTRTSSLSEKPSSHEPRRLAEWLNPTGAKQVHSLGDKIYQPKNWVMAWEKVKANRGSGGMDGQRLLDFEVHLAEQLERRHRELKEDTYQPPPVRRHLIPKAASRVSIVRWGYRPFMIGCVSKRC